MRFNVESDFKLQPVFVNPVILMQRIGAMLKRNIIARTEFETVDFERKPFKKYSLAYAKYKDEHKGSGSIVNLKSVLPVGTQMVVSIDMQNVNNDYVEVGVSGDNLEKAMWNENMGRVFLGINKDDEKDMDKIIDDYVEDELRKL